MAVEVVLSAGQKVGEVIDYSVGEDATPLTIGDSAGSVGQISVQAKAFTRGPASKRSGGVVGNQIELTDTFGIEGSNVSGYGSIAGQISTAAMPGERVNLTAQTILSRLNTERTAKPYFGSYTPPNTTVTTRTNLCTNPSRETNLTNVAINVGIGGAATLTRETSGGYDGNAFARAKWTSANSGTDGGIYDTIPGLTAGVSYTFSGFYRAIRATPPTTEQTPVQSLRMLVRFYNTSNAQVGNDFTYNASVYQNEWKRFFVSATAPNGTSYARAYCISGNAGLGWSTWKVNDTFDADMILVEQGPIGLPFTGSSAPTSVTSAEGVKVEQTFAWNGAVNNSTSIATVMTTTPGFGYNATEANYFRYLCDLVGLPNTNIDSRFESRTVAYSGWTGNVWKYMKDFAAAVRGEVALVDGVVTLRRPRTIEIPIEAISSPTVSVNTSQSSQFVEVINQNSQWGINESAFEATSNYQVESRGRTTVELTIPHFLTSANNPVVTDNYVADYDAGPGQYCVIDSQGLPVPSSYWVANGGSITARVALDDPSKLIVDIYGATQIGTAYVGPWRIARQRAGTPTAALEITGTGVFVNPETIRLRTGVSPSQTSVVTGSPIDNLFLTNANVASLRGLDAACRAAGPIVTLAGSISYSGLNGQSFGYIAGGRIRYNDNIFRITGSTIRRGGISFTAEADMTFDDVVELYSYTFGEFDALFPGTTFGQVNTMAGGKSIGEFAADFPNPTFAYVNNVYADARFVDHTVYPNIGEAISDSETQ